MHIIKVNQDITFNTLRGNSYFSMLNEKALGELFNNTTLRSYKKGETIFWEQDHCLGLYIIRKGSVKLYKLSPQGRELIVKVFEEGSTFNEVPVFDHSTNPINAEALEDTEIWLVDVHTIRSLLEKNPEMYPAVIKNLATNLRMLVDLVEELSFFQVTNRLAKLLITLTPAQLAGDESPRITQDQLAAHLGTVREVVTRSLRELEQSGAIKVDRRKIIILNQSMLENWG